MSIYNRISPDDIDKLQIQFDGEIDRSCYICGKLSHGKTMLFNEDEEYDPIEAPVCDKCYYENNEE